MIVEAMDVGKIIRRNCKEGEEKRNLEDREGEKRGKGGRRSSNRYW